MVDVRAAVPADVPAIRRIARESWHAAYGGFVPEPAIEGTLAEWYSEETVERGVTDDGIVYLVAEKESHDVVGYASATGGDENGAAILTSVYVVPERWGEGIGPALLEGVTGRLRERGFDRVRATVLADNEVGAAFYDRRGFERVAERAEELGGEQYEALVVERGL